MNSLNKTFFPNKNYKTRNWLLVNCKGQSLGRIATVITILLKGKLKSQYHPSVDSGDYVILINAESIIMDKTRKHFLVYNPGRPGHSLKIKTVSESLSKLTIEQSVKKMLSETETKRLMRRLKIYSDSNHLHQAQNPIEIDLKNLYSTIKY